MKKKYLDYPKSFISRLKDHGQYRVFNEITRSRNLPYSNHNNRQVINWCSNDYLGMSQNELVAKKITQTIKKFGCGSGGTRNISGTSNFHISLEKQIAKLHKKGSALLFTSAWVANFTTIDALSKIIPDLTFISDEKNHNCIIEGIRHSRRDKKIFKHNDVKDLEKILRETKGNKCVIFESLYSMDGDFSPVKEILDLCKRYNAISFVDEVHAVGIYGKKGAGYLEQIDCSADIINGTFGKAFGLQGGYVAGDSCLLDAVRHAGVGYIFTTSLPPMLCAGISQSIKIVGREQKLRSRLISNVNFFKKNLDNRNINYLKTKSHIIPVLIKDPTICKKISDELLQKHKMYVQPINYPTVPAGSERLRFAPTPFHTKKMIVDCVNALEKSISKFL